MTDPFALSDALVDEFVALNPLVATSLGIQGHDHLWPDFSPEGVTAERDLVGRYRAELESHLRHPDRWQRLAATVIHAYLGEREAHFAAGDHLLDVSHMASTFHDILMVFDLMDTTTAAGWENICTRLETIGDAFSGYRRKLEAGIEAGRVVAARQARSLIDQATLLGGEQSAFNVLIERAAEFGFAEITERLPAAIGVARTESLAFAEFLQDRYLPAAPSSDGVGEARYLRSADAAVGMIIDPIEVYQWGWDELARIRAEMLNVASEILPDASIREVVDLLTTDPDRCAPNRAAFVEFVKQRQNQAVAELEGVHFDLPDEVKQVSVNIAPPGGPLGAYYQPPSEDFTSRLGGIWYSLPPEDGPVPLYQEVSTAYHEGFPGHHLQFALVMTYAERLSRFHRIVIWYSGYGEGWALYTERLMHELGYLEKPDYVFGMLASHVFRAARVVVDIGLHLGLTIPEDAPLHPGAVWDYEKAVDYMNQVGLQTVPYAESEVQRYLGWPGQAISYKVGEREILRLRDEVRAREGSGFDLKEFHRRVLGHGEMRIDLLRRVVLDGWE